MTQDQVIELTRELPISEAVHFDCEGVTLLGTYQDELSLHRAKKNWTNILESNFLLEPEYDYSLSHSSLLKEGNFALQCHFLTACGRYAFWRLTNDQAPEAQYMIETAHIPNAELRELEFSMAPDMSPINSVAPLERNVPKSRGFSHVRDIVGKLLDLLRRKH